ALNCVMNSCLRDSRIFERVWVQPAAGDAGTGLGAALWVDGRERRAVAPGLFDAVERDGDGRDDGGEGKGAGAGKGEAVGKGEGGAVCFAPRTWQMDHVYLGPEYDDETIERALRWAKLPYTRCASTPELAAATAELLARDLIIGWFQGRMEFGPRSLGARSIIASPIDRQMQARLNELKDREDFRPVAPAVAHEDLAAWFSPAGANGGESPFMLFVYDVAPGQAERIPSACHTDHTARVQTVHAETNPRFHAVLKAFGDLSGVPVLVNTSFNVRGEPIVCTPRNAIEAFYSTPLDALVIGSFIVEKAP
ncbi:MAG: nodulation protein NodU, partial [Pseudomonadota bacterium]|nr:nodulation protein NodU [Pseudomonadota bacterium]